MKRWHAWILLFLALYAAIWLSAWAWSRFRGDPRPLRLLHAGLARVARFNTGVILSVLYLVLLPFFAVFFVVRDPLRLRKGLPPGGTYWQPVSQAPVAPERITRPF